MQDELALVSQYAGSAKRYDLLVTGPALQRLSG